MRWNPSQRHRRSAGGAAGASGPVAGCLSLLLLAAFAAHAQKPRVEIFTVGDGLPSATIYDLAQDASGRIWILSRAGLTLYDGHEFYRPASVDALPGHRLAVLEVDAAGRLWTVSRSEKRVFYQEGEGWGHLPLPPLVPDGGELRWATALLVPGRGQPLTVVGTADEGLLIWDGAVWTHAAVGDGPVSVRVTDLEVHGGKIFAGTAAGLCTLETSGVDCRLRDVDPRLSDRLFALRADPSVRRLWILGSDWLGWLEDGRLTVAAEGLEVVAWNRGPKGDLTFDAFGGVYFGSPAVVYYFDPAVRQLHELGLREGLAADGLTTILSDRESTVWLGSLRGLSKVTSRRFLSYDRGFGLLVSEVSAIAERRPGELILGHHGGLTLLEGNKIEALAFEVSAGEVTPRVLDMAVDDKGAVWIAAQDAGLLRLEGRDLTPVLNHAYTVEIDRDGRLWTAGNTGLKVAPEVRKRQIAAGDGFESVDLPLEGEVAGMLRWLAAGPGGELYLAARLGLLWRAGGIWHHARSADDEVTDVFNVLASAGDTARTTVWAGTAAGLYRLEGGELVKSSVPAIDRPVYQILEAKNRELERFTYTVSHDLKSPLVTIRGFVGLLRKDTDAGDVARVHRDVERIAAAAGTMGQLLDDLLELSRIGRMVNVPETVALGELIQEAVSVLEHQLSGVELQVASDLPAVSGDRVRLLEVVQNLIENATKFMGDQPSPRIEIGTRRGAVPAGGGADPEPVFYVSDNGIGIEPTYHDKVFGLFERLDASVEGTGVGLAIVHRIVDFHGGRIWVESEGVGKGSTFRFTLPGEARKPAPGNAGVAPTNRVP